MMRVRAVDRFLIFCALALIPLSAPCASAPKTSRTKTVSTDAWPKRTSLILKLDGIDRYFFPVSTKIDGLKKDQIATLLNQGEFAVIQDRLKSQPQQLARYRACLDYETSETGRKNATIAKRGFSLETLATLCLASKTKFIDDGIGYGHILKTTKTPETLLIYTDKISYNPALDAGIPSLNADKSKNGEYTGDAQRVLPDFCGGAFADPKACKKVCEMNIEASVCRTCSRFDSENIKYVNLGRQGSGFLSKFREKFYTSLKERPLSPQVVTAASFIEPEVLSKANQRIGVDVSRVTMYNAAPPAESIHIVACAPCPSDATIDKQGKCMKNGCDLGQAIYYEMNCKKKTDCANDEVLENGQCHDSCVKTCEKSLAAANEYLKHYDSWINNVKNNFGLQHTPIGTAVNKFGKLKVIELLERHSEEVQQIKNKLKRQAEQCKTE
jgi:hypothetical protein